MAAQAAARTIKARLDRLRRRALGRARAAGGRSCRARCGSATRRSPFARAGHGRPIWRGSRSRRPASTRRRRSTGTAAPAAAGRSTISPTAPRCSEVAVDTLTGEYRVERVDILHDVGSSLNPAIDLRPDRGRLHPGHGLAHHRGAVVGQRGPAAHPCAQHLQDPACVRPAAGLQRRAARERAATARRRSIAPRRSASRR